MSVHFEAQATFFMTVLKILPFCCFFSVSTGIRYLHLFNLKGRAL